MGHVHFDLQCMHLTWSVGLCSIGFSRLNRICVDTDTGDTFEANIMRRSLTVGPLRPLLSDRLCDTLARIVASVAKHYFFRIICERGYHETKPTFPMDERMVSFPLKREPRMHLPPVMLMSQVRQFPSIFIRYRSR